MNVPTFQLNSHFKIIDNFEDIEKNRLGDINQNMISFTGCGSGIDHRGILGVVSNRTSYGDYYDDEGNLVVRERAADNIDSG